MMLLGTLDVIADPMDGALESSICTATMPARFRCPGAKRKPFLARSMPAVNETAPPRHYAAHTLLVLFGRAL